MTEGSKGISRRKFLKGAAGVAGVAAMGGLVGCTSDDEGKSGDNGGKSSASGGVMTAEKYGETKWSFEIMPEEYPLPDKKITKTISHDIIVIGSGMSGLTTAVSAKEDGADVRIISAGSKAIGRGGSNHAIGSKKQKELGIDYSPDNDAGRHATKIEKISAAHYIDERKWSIWINNSGKAMDWMIDKMESKGLKVCMEPGYTDPDGVLTVPPASHNFYTDEQPMGVLFGAPICAQAYADIFKDMGGEIDFNTKALYLIREDDNKGRVTGVVAENLKTGDIIKYEAKKGIVLATGDFSRNADMMAKYAPWAWDIYKNSLETTKADYDAGLIYNGLMPGDGQKMGLWVGAAWQKTYPNAPAINCGAVGPKVNSIDNFWGINLTGDGKRYHNEVTNFSYGAISLLQLSDRISFSIWDSQYAYIQDEWELVGASVNAENGIGPITPEQLVEGWEQNVKAGQFFKADTIEELLDQLGFTGEAKTNALESIENYNKYAEQGIDEEYHVNPSVLHPIKTGPFYGGRTHFNKNAMTFLTITGGLRTNEYLQVCEEDDTPIDGLFNTGTMVGDFYSGVYNFVLPGQNLGALCNCLSHVLGKNLADPNFKFKSGKIQKMTTPEEEAGHNLGENYK